MNNQNSKPERAHIERIKEMPCAVCNAPAPSDAHHIWQSSAYLCIPLCKDCHQNPKLGIHGQKVAWNIRKMDELDALAITIRRLVA